MKLSSFTEPKFIDLALDGDDKDSVIASLAGLVSRSSKLKDRNLFRDDVLAREKLVTTGVGHGVAFPHAKSEAVSGVVFAFGRTTSGVDFGATALKNLDELAFSPAAPVLTNNPDGNTITVK